ncbi:hypothetical protein [Phenylobacterium montanum]|uniref:Uncharacterized protein n=1 Tax=Phenylobacterium montanum TaxID=2823693 RepID=A0A975G3Q0_9CAUL|nr:hypothetical protein [Caulobacter sp. S6]QUD90568.1 hypothetical protein KCG34_12205 [Caulobacter sp. S6]
MFETDQLPTYRFNLKTSRPYYSLSESEEPQGFEEQLELRMSMTASVDIPGLPSEGYLFIRGVPDLAHWNQRLGGDDPSYPGIGLVQVKSDAVVVDTYLEFDTIWRLAGAIKSGHLGVAVVECEPLAKPGDKVFLRELSFQPA